MASEAAPGIGFASTNQSAADFYMQLVQMNALEVQASTVRMEASEVQASTSALSLHAEARQHAVQQQAPSAKTAATTEFAAESSVAYAIDSSNVGFKLLKKAGWAEGTGLGVNEQGTKEPLQPFIQKGNRGLGFDGAAAAAPGAQVPLHPQVVAHKAATAAEQRQRREAQRAAVALGSARRDKLAALVEAELAAESVEDKVKRYQVVARHEADASRSRAIHRYLAQALNEPEYSASSNPISRANRMTALNPLLD